VRIMQKAQSSNRIVNLGPPECEAGALTTAQLCLVRDRRKSEENERESVSFGVRLRSFLVFPCTFE
jgi:hypothetical protein